MGYPFEASLDRRVVGETEPQAVEGKLPLLRRPGARRLGDLEVVREQVIDRAGMGLAVQSEALAQRLEGSGVLGGSQVEVAAEEQWRIPRPLGRRLGRPQDIRRRQIRPVVGRVQVGDAEVGAVAERDARERHRSPLRPPDMDLQLPPLHDPSVPMRLFPFMEG
jgi:hypothetical protein